jgi:collagen type V/XI/XXIV/XXVII alpha
MLNPGRSCHDIMECHTELVDGYHYIDPNLGCGGDAIEVFCNFTSGGETCVELNITVMDNGDYNDTGKVWFTVNSQRRNLQYGIGQVQLVFLRLLSTQAHQYVTIRCLGTPVWYSNETQSYDYALKLKGWNGHIVKWNDDNPPSVISDTCQFQRPDSNVWGETALVLSTPRLDELPIVEFWVEHQGSYNAAVIIELGAVCFR